VKQALADALQEIWKDIPVPLLESLYSSMPRREEAVIKAEGWYTKGSVVSLYVPVSLSPVRHPSCMKLPTVNA